MVRTCLEIKFSLKGKSLMVCFSAMNDEQKGKHIFVAKFSLLTEFLKKNKGFYLTSH